MIDIDAALFFSRSPISMTRGHAMKLSKSHCPTARDANMFWNPIVNVWNALPADIALAPSVSTFKSRLHNYDFSAFCNA